MELNYKPLGKFIRKVDNRNKDAKITNLVGLSMTKEFRKSTSNIIGTDLSKYKIVGKWQFSCDFMSVIRVLKLPVVLHDNDDEIIISPAYTVFEIIDTSLLLPEYLMMWFRRSEFDRYAYFRCDSAVRGGFNWAELCEVKLPIPSIEKQREIVKEYNTIVNRITLNETLNQKLEETAQAIYKHWFVDFEFPNKDGKPYKSSGGKMSYNEELGKEIPEGWAVKPLVSFSDIKGGKRMPAGFSLTSKKNNHPYIKVADLGTKKFALLNDKYEYVPNDIQSKIARYIVSEGDLIISIVGTVGIVKIINKSLNTANLTENCIKITNLSKLSTSYLYHYLMSTEGQNEIEIRNVGAVQAKLPMYNIETFPITCPSESVFKKFNKVSSNIDENIQNLQEEEILLLRMKNLILSKMSKVETETAVM